MTLYILTAATLLLVALTFLPLWRVEFWWIRVLDFPRLQILVLALAVLLLQLLLLDLSSDGNWLLLVITLVCLGYQAWWIFPYSPFCPVEVASSTPGDRDDLITIMTANVLMPNRNAPALIHLLQAHSPDILVTLESNSWWQSQLQTIEKDYPYNVKCPMENLYGMHVYSRLPVSKHSIKYLVEPDVPSIHTVVTLPSGRQVRVYFLHPAPPSPTENDESSERDAELIIVAKDAEKSTLPVIVTGDLNDVAWSETTRLFRKISGLLDPRVGRGMFNTFHADLWLARWPLDHIFHSRHFTLHQMRRLPKFGSDHFAILTTLAFQPNQHDQDTGLSADKEDHQRARDKLDQQ